MFETLVTGVLTNVMGNFIDPKCFSSDKINVAVWSGYVVLRDLELKPEVIAHPSVNLVRGVVGSIELKIPWNRLQSESVVLTVDDVYLLVRTEEDIEGVLMEMDEFTIKKQLLEQLYQEAKKTQQAEKETTSDSPKEDGFTSRLVNKIIDNIELHIRRIHIRLEDHTTGDHPFAAGLTIESVHAQSTNSNWQPSYVDTAKSNEPRIYKMIELNHLSVYLNPHCEVLRSQRVDFQNCSLEDFCHAFNHSIPKRFDDRHPIQLYPFQQRHHFILKPLDASARLIVNRDPFDTSIPKFEVDITIAEVAVRLEESQYCDLLYLVSAFQVPEHHKKYQQYRKLRPRESVFDAPAGQWWNYAINAVIQDIRTKKLRWSWKYMKKRRDDRIKYQLLWERHVRDIELGPNKSTLLLDSEDECETDEDVDSRVQSSLTNSDMSSVHSTSSQVHTTDGVSGRALDGALVLDEIERQRPIEDILFFRYLADKKMDEEYRIRGEELEQTASQVLMPPFSDSESVDTELTESNLPTEMRYRSWGKWMFGWTSRVGAAPSPDEKSSAPKRAFPEVELRELFKIVEYEPARRAKRRHQRGADRANGSYVDLDGETDNTVSDLVSRVTLSLGKGSITLASDPEINRRLTRDDPNYASRYAPTDFLLGSFTDLQVAAITKGTSTKIDVSLHTIDAFDESADSMAFSRLLTRKQDRAVSSSDDDGGLMNANRMAGPIFLLSYETNPVGIAADAALFVHLEPLEIVFSPTARCWGRLGSFLSTPQALGLWAELEVASFNDIVNLKARTEAKLEYVMANRVALSIDLRVQAPLIVIPESDSDISCARMVIDLGHINFRTERLSKLDSNAATMQSSAAFVNGSAPSSLALTNPLASPPLTSSMSFVKQLYDEAERGEGAIRWKEEFYDKFALAITNVHVLLIPHGAALSSTSKDLLRAGLPVPTSASLLGVRLSSEWELVERFNINITLRTSVLPLDATLTRIYIHADLPALTFNLSLEKYFQLVALAERFGSTAPPVPVDGERQQLPSFGQSFFGDEKEQLTTASHPSGLTNSALKSLDAKDGHDIKLPQLRTHGVDNRDEDDELSDAESDDTWFSITSGSVDVRATGNETREAFTLSEFEDFSLYATSNSETAEPSTSLRESDTSTTQQKRAKSRGRRGSFTLGSGEVIDRRLFVCTFTIPVIAVHLKKPQCSNDIPLSASMRYDGGRLYDDDFLDGGTLVVKLEGFRVRIGKKTLSTQVDFSFRSLDVEDYFDLSGRSSEHLLFSSPAIAAPYDLRAPPRRSVTYAVHGASRRRVSRQRERVLTFQSNDGNSNTSRAGSLLDVTFASSSDRRTGAEVGRDLSVRVGAIHLVFDQSYVCSLLELFEDTLSKISTLPNVAIDDDDGEEDFVDAMPPPLELSPTISQEFSLPMKLTESVMADLERAKKELLEQQTASIAVSSRSGVYDSTKLAVSLSVKAMIESVSVLLCDRSDAVASIAVIGTKLQFSIGGEELGDDMNLTAIVEDVRIFDLLSAKNSVTVIGRLSVDPQVQPNYAEIFGLQRHEGDESVRESVRLLEMQGIAKKRPLHSERDDTSTSEANIRIQPIQLVVHSPFIEGVVNYVAHGALATHLASKRESLAVGKSRRRKRTDSFGSELSHHRPNDHSVGSPLSVKNQPSSLNGTPFFGPMLEPSLHFTDPKQQSSNATNGKHTSDARCDSRFVQPVLKVELMHPSIVFPCGRELDSSAEALVLDLGVITAHAPGDTSANGARINVEGFRILTRSDQAKVLEETSIQVTYKSSFATEKTIKEHSVDISVSPLTINIGERDLCLGIDLWNDVFEPMAQVIASVSRSPLGNATHASESLQNTSPSVIEKTSACVDISLIAETLKLVMVAKPSIDFETWVKSTMDTIEAQWNRDSNTSYAPGGTPGSPRRRRHLYSFAQEEQGGFRSVTGAPSLVSVAEIAFIDLRGSVKMCVGPPEIAHGQSIVCGSLSVHEILVRDTLADETEFFCQVLSRVPTSSASTPQVKAEFRLVDLADHENGCDQELNAEVILATATLCLLPRTLLRIENYLVGVVIALGQKLAQQDPRIVSAVEQQSLLLTDAKTASSSIVDQSSSHDRVSGYPSGRSRKNSIAESLKDAYAGSISARLKDVYEESELSLSSKNGDKKSRMILRLKAQLDHFQLWMLPSDRKRDTHGVCLSGGFHLTVEHYPSLFSGPNPCSSVLGKASEITVVLGSPTELDSQCFEVVEPVAVDVQIIVRHFNKSDESSDIPREIREQHTEGVPPLWDAWKFVDTSVSLTTVSTKVSYKDLPVILKTSSMLSAIVGAESHVRRKLEAIAPQTVDPYLDLALYESERGDEAFAEIDTDRQPLSNSVFRMKLGTDSINFRLINNLVDENSPVVGFRMGPIHLSAKDISDSSTIVEGSCSLEAWYHNLRLVASEPLIEPWSFSLRCWQDKSADKSIAHATGDDFSDSERSQYPWQVSISSSEFIQFNVTDALITNIMAANRAWEWMSKESGVDSSDRSEYSTYWIRNETGLLLRYWSRSCTEDVLGPGDEKPLTFRGMPRSRSGDSAFDKGEVENNAIRQLYIAAEDGGDVASALVDGNISSRGRWESEFAIPVDQADSRMYALVDFDAESHTSSRVRKCECVIDVLVERGCKVFVVRSTLILENNTASDLEVEYVPPLRRTASPPFRAGVNRGHLVPAWKAVVRPSSTIPVPVNLVSAMDGYLMVRPPDLKSPVEGSTISLPKAYAKKRVHLPLFDRVINVSADVSGGTGVMQNSSGEPQCVIKFHRLYGDRPVRPFMMSATLSFATDSLYQRKVTFQPPLVLHNLTAGPLEYSIATPSEWKPATDGVNNPSSSVNLGWEDCQQRLRERGVINVADSLVWHLCDWDTPLELRIRVKGFEWSEPLQIDHNLVEDTRRIRMIDLSSNAHLFVSAEMQVNKSRCREIFFFVPYWIVNLTGLKLEYEHDDERAAYEHSTMLLAGQKRLDRDEMLLKEEQARSSNHHPHPHLVRTPTSGRHSAGDGDANGEDSEASSRTTGPSDDRRRRHPGLIPSVPPIKGLLDLLPKPIEDSRSVGQLEVLQACHSSTQPERGCIRVRVNEFDRRITTHGSESSHRKWTDSIVLDQPGTSGELEAADFGLDRVYSIGYSITTAKGRYSRTKVIMLTPRFMIINAMDAAVEICHSSAKSSPSIDDPNSAGNMLTALNPALHLEPGGYADFHWSLALTRSKTIRCRLADGGWTWSGAVPLGEAREYVVRMRNESTRATKLVRVVLKVDGPCVCVFLREESSSVPPYRIENYSLETFRIHQRRVRRSEILLPHHSLDYAWDEPTEERVLVVDMLPSAAGDNSRPLRIGSFVLDKIHRFPDGLGGTLGIEITADGPTRVLRFTDTRIRAAGAIDANGNASTADSREGRSLDVFPAKFLASSSFELTANLQGIGISIVDGTPRELIYVAFSGISLEMHVSNDNDDSMRATGSSLGRIAKETHPKILAMRFQLRDFQIDNQLPVTPYPVLLRFSNPNARTRVIDGKILSVPVMEVCLVKHDGYTGIEFIRHFSMRVLPLHIRVDGSLLYQLLPVFVHSKGSNNREAQGWSRSKYSQATVLLEEYHSSLEIGVDILDVMREDGVTSVLASSSTATDRESIRTHHSEFETLRRPSFTVAVHTNNHGKLVSKAEAKKLYFEDFHIDPIRATVSFSFGASAGAMVDGLHSLSDSARHSSITVGPLRLIINAIGTSLAKIANAPFHLKAISINHSFIQPDALASRLASHYQSEALRQAYVILGSVDVFGNPMVAWRNLRGGFQDFIYEPVHGISKSPTEFALGMGRGTYSLMRASVYTLLDFISRILAASSLGLSEACLKLDEYTGYPATRNIYQGFAQGISGIVVSPIRAVELNGVRGVIPGVFAGVFGFALKPLLGLSLATSSTVATLRDAIDPNTKALLMRSRPPRHIDLRTRRLKVYSYVESFGEEMVGKLRGGRYRSDGYLGHVDLKQKCFLVTRKRILFIDVKPGKKYEVEWELQADEVVLVDWQSRGEESALALFFIEEDYTPRRRLALAAKGMLLSKHVVPLPENRVLFVRAMLQQQERSLVFEDPENQSPRGASRSLPPPLAQRAMSIDRLPTWQQHVPSEYPIFRLPMMTATRSLSNLHTQGPSLVGSSGHEITGDAELVQTVKDVRDEESHHGK